MCGGEWVGVAVVVMVVAVMVLVLEVLVRGGASAGCDAESGGGSK